MVLNSSQSDDHGGFFALFQRENGPIFPAVVRMVIIGIQVNDLLSILGQPWVVPAIFKKIKFSKTIKVITVIQNDQYRENDEKL